MQYIKEKPKKMVTLLQEAGVDLVALQLEVIHEGDEKTTISFNETALTAPQLTKFKKYLEKKGFDLV